MNISAAASASPELLAAALPPAANSPAAAPAPPAARAQACGTRAADAERARDGDHEGFARTLRDEIGAGRDAADPERAARHTDGDAAKGVSRKATPATSDDDGGDAPPSGNGLPPWLAALPLTMPTPPAADGAAADAATPDAAAATAPVTLATSTPSALVTPPTTSESPSAGTDLDTGATATPSAALPTTATASLDPSFDVVDVAPGAPPLEPPALASASDDGAASQATVALERATALAAATLQDETAPAALEAPAANAPVAAATTAIGASPARDLARTLASARTAAASAARADGEARPAAAPRSFLPAAETARTALREARGEPQPPPFALDESPNAATAPMTGAGTAFTPGNVVAGAAPADPSPATIAPLAPTPAMPLAAATVRDANVPSIPLAVGAPDWDRQLADKVQVLVDQGLTNAQLKLSPAHLGPLEIRISLQDDRANVWFGTHSHATREALEAAAPRLRDALGSQGFSNVGVSVDLQQQASRQPAAQGGGRHESELSFAAGDGAARPDVARGTTRATTDRSRLDAFA